MPPTQPGVIVDLRSTMSRDGLEEANLHELLRVREGQRHGPGRRPLSALRRRPLPRPPDRGERVPVGGTHFACPHEIPRSSRCAASPLGSLRAARHHTAAASRDGRDRARPSSRRSPSSRRRSGTRRASGSCGCCSPTTPATAASSSTSCSLAQATVSQHLKVLKDAGLIVGEIEGLRTCYCASRDRLAELHDLVGRILDEAVEVDTTGCD